MPPCSHPFDLNFWKNYKKMFLRHKFESRDDTILSTLSGVVVLLVFTTKPITSFLGSLFGWGGLSQKMGFIRFYFILKFQN